MKKSLIVVCILVLAYACGSTKSAKNLSPEEKVAGLWTEHWRSDPNSSATDVNYVDTLKLGVAENGNLKISCINNDYYSYEDIVYDGKKLSFVMVNGESTDEKFTIQYDLQLININRFEGGIVNVRGKKAIVDLKRLVENK